MEIEMYVGIYQGNAQVWFTEMIQIPSDTPEDDVQEVACQTILKSLEGRNLHVAFVGIYHEP